MADSIDQGYPEIVDTQEVTPPLDGDPLDLGLRLGPPLVDIAEGSGVYFGGDGFVHVLLTATDSGTGNALDLIVAEATVTVAVTSSSPVPEDYKTGDWLGRTAETAPGLYARANLSGLALLPGEYYFVQVKVALEGKVLVRQATDVLLVVG